MFFIQSFINYECEDEFYDYFVKIFSTNSFYVVNYFIVEVMFCWGCVYIYYFKENQSCSDNICIEYEVYKFFIRCWFLLSISDNITLVNKIF